MAIRGLTIVGSFGYLTREAFLLFKVFPDDVLRSLYCCRVRRQGQRTFSDVKRRETRIVLLACFSSQWHSIPSSGGCTMRLFQVIFPIFPFQHVCSPRHVLMPTISRSPHPPYGHLCLPSLLPSVQLTELLA